MLRKDDIEKAQSYEEARLIYQREYKRLTGIIKNPALIQVNIELLKNLIHLMDNYHASRNREKFVVVVKRLFRKISLDLECTHPILSQAYCRFVRLETIKTKDLFSELKETSEKEMHAMVILTSLLLRHAGYDEFYPQRSRKVFNIITAICFAHKRYIDLSYGVNYEFPEEITEGIIKYTPIGFPWESSNSLIDSLSECGFIFSTENWDWDDFDSLRFVELGNYGISYNTQQIGKAIFTLEFSDHFWNKSSEERANLENKFIIFIQKAIEPKLTSDEVTSLLSHLPEDTISMVHSFIPSPQDEKIVYNFDLSHTLNHFFPGKITSIIKQYSPDNDRKRSVAQIAFDKARFFSKLCQATDNANHFHFNFDFDINRLYKTFCFALLFKMYSGEKTKYPHYSKLQTEEQRHQPWNFLFYDFAKYFNEIYCSSDTPLACQEARKLSYFKSLTLDEKQLTLWKKNARDHLVKMDQTYYKSLGFFNRKNESIKTEAKQAFQAFGRECQMLTPKDVDDFLRTSLTFNYKRK